MLFNSVGFWLFFAAFIVVYRGLARTRDARLWTIAVGSLVFYGAWDVRFVPLLLGMALFDYFIARAIAATDDPSRRKRLLYLSIATNLGVLATFKYLGFFVSSAWSVLRLLGVQADLPVLHVLLPIGISFYTFQSMSYTIDVYRKRLRPATRAVELVAAVSFFPHLVAGPIVRASTLLPQLEDQPEPSVLDVRRGWLMIGTGLLNKNIADILADTVQRSFRVEVVGDPLRAWTGAIAFAAQIYGDFAGYSAIAIGVALLLGIKLPANFDLPYLSTSISDFWARWHISLSTWIREYCFFPLAMRFPTRPYLVLVGTMTLVGFWHGASWTFVVYGAYHGTLMVIEEIVGERRPDVVDRVPAPVLRIVQTALTFYFVLIGFVLFRSATFGGALAQLGAMHGVRAHLDVTFAAVVTLILAVCALVFGHLLSSVEVRGEEARILRRPLLLWTLVVACIALTISVGKPGAQFIYFQF